MSSYTDSVSLANGHAALYGKRCGLSSVDIDLHSIASFPGSPAFPYCKRRKAGWGLGTRLDLHGHPKFPTVPHPNIACILSLQCSHREYIFRNFDFRDYNQFFCTQITSYLRTPWTGFQKEKKSP